MEIERKFLVLKTLPPLVGGVQIEQGYLHSDEKKEIRVRMCDDQSYLTIKYKKDERTRDENEFPIPFEQATLLLKKHMTHSNIKKVRYDWEYEGLTWEIDVFEGENQGLILAEVELEFSNQNIAFPSWVGKEVTHDARYYNSSLQKRPFQKWGF